MPVEVARGVRPLLAIAALLVGACTGGIAGPEPAGTSDADIDIAGPVTVTLWHAFASEPQKSAFEAMVKRFNETNGKGVTVAPIAQGGAEQLYQKTLSAIQANAMPDMVQAYESFVSDFAKAGAVVDLDPYVNSKKNGLDRASQNDIHKPYVDAGRFPQYGNKLLSFPFSRSLAVMYADLDVLAKAGISSVPRTWPEWEDAVKRTTVKDASGKTTQYGTIISTDASQFDAAVLAMGGRLMADDNKTVAWDGKEGLAYLQLLDRLARGGYAYAPRGTGWESDLARGKLAFAFSATTTLPSIAAEETAPVKLAITAGPQADPQHPHTVQFGGNIAILRSDPRKQLAAWLFIEWFEDQQQTAEWAAKSSYMPARKSAADVQVLKDYWAKQPLGKQAFDVIGASQPEPNVRGQPEIRDVITNMIVSVINKRATPEQAIKNAATAANGILKESQ